MKIILVRTDCRDKLSAQCEGTFTIERKRGRPQVNCNTCKAVKKPATSSSPEQNREGKCPCGNTFVIKAGRGRKATKCDSCRDSGTVYRMDDDGILQEIRADQIKREEQDRLRAAGQERAMLLVMRMKPLTEKTDRQVIVR